MPKITQTKAISTASYKAFEALNTSAKAAADAEIAADDAARAKRNRSIKTYSRF